MMSSTKLKQIVNGVVAFGARQMADDADAHG